LQNNNIDQSKKKVSILYAIKSFLKIILPPIVIIGTILTIRINFFDYLYVSGSSMYPTLEDKQMILVDKTIIPYCVIVCNILLIMLFSFQRTFRTFDSFR